MGFRVKFVSGHEPGCEPRAAALFSAEVGFNLVAGNGLYPVAFQVVITAVEHVARFRELGNVSGHGVLKQLVGRASGFYAGKAGKYNQPDNAVWSGATTNCPHGISRRTVLRRNRLSHFQILQSIPESPYPRLIPRNTFLDKRARFRILRHFPPACEIPLVMFRSGLE